MIFARPFSVVFSLESNSQIQGFDFEEFLLKKSPTKEKMVEAKGGRNPSNWKSFFCGVRCEEGGECFAPSSGPVGNEGGSLGRFSVANFKEDFHR